MNKIIRVVCPEHEQNEVVEVQDDGEIRWCSRVAGRPSCGGFCISQAMAPELAPILPPTADPTEPAARVEIARKPADT